MLPVTLRCPAVFDFNADGVSSLHQHNKCKSSQPQRIHNEYFPSQVLSAVVISLNLGTVASPPLIPPQVFFIYLFLLCMPLTMCKSSGDSLTSSLSLFSFIALCSVGTSSHCIHSSRFLVARDVAV